MADYSPYQQKIIKRYYDNIDKVALLRLSELVTDLFLAEGKKRDRLWQQAAVHMKNCGVPQSRIDHVLKEANPKLLADVVAELQRKG